MIQKADSEWMIDLNAEKVMFVVKTIVIFIFEINSGSIYMAMASMS